MSVIIKVVGAKPESEEYLAALKVRSVLEKEFSDDFVTGQIILHANANIVGQRLKDIDLKNYKTKVNFTDIDRRIVNDYVEIRSFCTAIEVKGHGRDGIVREGTEIYVKYGNKLHSATSQSNEQKNSIFDFFTRTFDGQSPYVTNLIFFTGVSKYELNEIPSNVIAADFTANDLFQVIVHQYDPKEYKGYYSIGSSSGYWSPEQLETVFGNFVKSKDGCGEITRKRIEQITSRSVKGSIDNVDLDKMTLCRGRAGTGKTIALIRKAIQLVDENGARVLILTYNNALVSDIRRLFALADLPDMFQPSCVDINTMQSFFYKLINKSLYDDSLSGEEYLNKYDSLIDEMNQFLKDDETKDELVELLKKDYYLNWDYCFVDEAQDWTEKERDILIRLFEEHLLIADGGQQFVRAVEGCDWNIVDKRNNIRLKKSLRQENNIISFINDLANMVDENATTIQPNDLMPGGKIIIQENSIDAVTKTIKDEIVTMKKCGNIPYDLLAFVPHTYVDKDTNSFIYKKQFLLNDIDIWDGTNDEIRSSYSISGDKIRVLQYESGRGLEGWCVVCFELDTFIKNKLAQYKSLKNDSFLLESDEDQKKKYLLNWLLLPLTRPIDNLLITFKDPNSYLAKAVYSIANKHPDYINVVR